MPNIAMSKPESRRAKFVSRMRFTFDMLGLALAALIVINGGVDSTIGMFAKLAG